MWAELFLAFVSLLLARCTVAQQLTECAASGVIEVTEKSPNFNLTCTDYTSPLHWTYGVPDRDQATIGSCNTSSCNLSDNYAQLSLFRLTYLSSSSSRLTSTLTTKNASGVVYLCKSARCLADIVVPAELSQTTVIYNQIGWTLQAWSYVNKIYSSQGRYSCLWYRTIGNGTEIKFNGTLILTPNPGNVNNIENRNGSCSLLPFTLPSSPEGPQAGPWRYRVVVSPGNKSKDAIIQIDRPTTPSVTCLPIGYVPENSDVTCTCRTQSVGHPPGRLQFVKGSDNSVISSGNYNDTMFKLSLIMTRNGGDLQLRCDVDWATLITGQQHNATVSYGPDIVTILGNRTFYTDATGSHDLLLTCQPQLFKPSFGLVYTWTGPCAHITSSTCTFKPRPPSSSGGSDVNANVTCTVHNPSNNNTSALDSFQLDLKYPPATLPQISGYTEGQVMYQGDSLTLTCNVTGGVPIMNSVTLTCAGRTSNVTAGQSSSVRISFLDSSDHERTCECSGQWAVLNFYTLTNTRTLTVYYPPSVPLITRKDGLAFPYLENDTALLSCEVISRGNPGGTLTWLGHDNGQTSNPDESNVTLVMKSLDKRNNNQTITCRATNDFTMHKGQEVKSTFIVKVFYRPVIFMYATGNSCQVETIGEYKRCVVKEGQRVQITCSGESNPPPATTVWRKANNGRDIDSSSDLVIDRTDHKAHNGVYSCTVTTRNLGNEKQPPTLSATDQLTLLVKYGPEQPIAKLNDAEDTLTVSERDLVVLTCHTDGRPTPNMTLYKNGIRQVQFVAGGVLDVAVRVSWLNHTLDDLQCQDAGNYTCTARNDEGTQTTTVTLFVNCKPRLFSVSEPPPNVNYVNQSVHLTFDLLAYPLPTPSSFLYLGKTLDTSHPGMVVSNILLDARCRVLGEVYEVGCDITVNKVTENSAGYYRLDLVNDHGADSFLFQVKFNDFNVPVQEKSVFPVGAVVGGGLAAAVAVVISVVAVVLFLRRRKNDDGAMVTNSVDDSSGDDGTMVLNSVYESSGDFPIGHSRPKPKNEYEVVEHVESAHVAKTAEPATSACEGGEKIGPLSNIVSKGAKAALETKPASSAEECLVYARVNKKKETLQSNLPEAKETKTPEKSRKQFSKQSNPKFTSVPKSRGTKQGGEKDKRGPVYGNMMLLSMEPSSKEVYENFAFAVHPDESAGKKANALEGAEATIIDGLIYTDIEFTENQRKKGLRPAPQRETTEYVSIDFTKHAPRD